MSQKDYIKGYENGAKAYRRWKGRYFNMKYIPKNITDSDKRLDYAEGWHTGWDDAQKEDITVNR